MVLGRCLECFASNAYSCFSKVALTVMAVLKVIVSISIIVVVAVKLEDVRIEVQLPDLTTLEGLVNATTSIVAGGGGAASPGASSVPLPSPAPASAPSLPSGATVDINTTAGPFHVDAACLLQKRGSAGQLDGNSRTMCSYVFGVCAISLVATLLMTSLLWCTCHLCGWGPVLELAFALLGAAWWLAAALVLQEHTQVSLNAAPAALRLIYGNPPPPPAGAAAPPPRLPPLPPPSPPLSGDLADELGALLHTWMPANVRQWRQAVVGLSWTMMAMFTVSGVLLLVEACGCLFDCCGCLCRCCCCPDRPESRWRSRMRRRKALGGDEYIEMCGTATPSASVGGAPPAVMIVARSDGSPSPEKASPSKRGWWR